MRVPGTRTAFCQTALQDFCSNSTVREMKALRSCMSWPGIHSKSPASFPWALSLALGQQHSWTRSVLVQGGQAWCFTLGLPSSMNYMCLGTLPCVLLGSVSVMERDERLQVAQCQCPEVTMTCPVDHDLSNQVQTCLHQVDSHTDRFIRPSAPITGRGCSCC